MEPRRHLRPVKPDGIEWHRNPPDTKEDVYQHGERLVPDGLIGFEPRAFFYQSGIVSEHPHSESYPKTEEQNQEDPAVEPNHGAGWNK